MFVSNRPTPRHGDRPSSPVLVVSLLLLLLVRMRCHHFHWRLSGLTTTPFASATTGEFFFFGGGVVGPVGRSGDGAAPAGAKGHGRRRHLHPSCIGRGKEKDLPSLVRCLERPTAAEEGRRGEGLIIISPPSLLSERNGAGMREEEGGGMKKDGGKIEMRKGKRAPTYCKSRM